MRTSTAAGSALAVVIAAGVWMGQGAQVRGQQAAQGQPTGQAAPSAAQVKATSKEQFDRWMTQVSNWGRWGKDDQLGALHLITPDKRRKAAALVKTGTSISLSRPATPDPAVETRKHSGRVPGQGSGLGNFFGFSPNPKAVDMWMAERQEVEYHGGRFTHVDAFCHGMYAGKMYNGVEFTATVTSEGGCAKNSIASLKGGLVTRGVLIDLPGAQVFPQDIEAWEKKTGITIGPGDALLLRSNRTAARQTGGWDPSIGPFLRARDVSLLGSDFYQEGGSVPGVFLPIHSLTLVALGVHLFDNLDLDTLAETAKQLNRWEFLLMAAPPPIANGAGSLINPIAVF